MWSHLQYHENGASSFPVGPKPGKSSATLDSEDFDRKQSARRVHIRCEQKYRNNLNYNIKVLGQKIPALEGEKPSKPRVILSLRL